MTRTAAAFTVFAYFNDFTGNARNEEHEVATLADALARTDRLWADYETTNLVSVCISGTHTDGHGREYEFDGYDLDCGEGPVSAFLARYRQEQDEEDEHYQSLCRSEGRWMAGSAFGNQGLADFGGLELDHDGYEDR